MSFKETEVSVQVLWTRSSFWALSWHEIVSVYIEWHEIVSVYIEIWSRDCHHKQYVRVLFHLQYISCLSFNLKRIGKFLYEISSVDIKRWTIFHRLKSLYLYINTIYKAILYMLQYYHIYDTTLYLLLFSLSFLSFFIYKTLLYVHAKYIQHIIYTTLYLSLFFLSFLSFFHFPMNSQSL